MTTVGFVVSLQPPLSFLNFLHLLSLFPPSRLLPTLHFLFAFSSPSQIRKSSSSSLFSIFPIVFIFFLFFFTFVPLFFTFFSFFHFLSSFLHLLLFSSLFLHSSCSFSFTMLSSSFYSSFSSISSYSSVSSPTSSCSSSSSSVSFFSFFRLSSSSFHNNVLLFPSIFPPLPLFVLLLFLFFYSSSSPTSFFFPLLIHPFLPLPPSFHLPPILLPNFPIFSVLYPHLPPHHPHTLYFHSLLVIADSISPSISLFPLLRHPPSSSYPHPWCLDSLDPLPSLPPHPHSARVLN